MIARLTGKVVEREPKALILDVQGIGYRVAVLSTALERAKVGDTLTLKIHHHVSADAQALYGFIKNEDLQYFQLLLTVPSVGPRTAMNILEIAPPATLAQAVSEHDTALLTKVSGIGRKTAQRIIVELQGKLDTLPGTVSPGSNIQSEAMNALVSIGFTTAQARRVVQKLPKDIATVEDAVRAALQANVKH